MKLLAGKTHYIAKSRHQQLFEKLTQTKFISLLMDGLTDKGNADDEIFMAVWCDSTSADEKMHTTFMFVQHAGLKLQMHLDYFRVSKVHC